jgi:hypothetical protein
MLRHGDILLSGGTAPLFLISSLDGGEWSFSRPDRFTPGTHMMGGWVGSRGGLGAVEKRKILHCRESNQACPVRSPSLYRLSYPDSILI